MALEAFIVILLCAGQWFTASDGAGDSPRGSLANPEVICHGERSLLGDGFHRDLKTYLEITSTNEVNMSKKCEVLLIENLSSSFYIDPYQIETAQGFGGPKVFSYDVIDLEKPEFLSPPLRLYVFRQMELHANVLSSNVSMPLHIRYHRPLDGPSHVHVEVMLPVVYIACPDVDWLKTFDRTTAPCSKDASINCTWTEISCSFPEESLRFVVPVGNLQHFGAIVVLTVLVISISTVGIVAKMFSPGSTAPSSTDELKKQS